MLPMPRRTRLKRWTERHPFLSSMRRGLVWGLLMFAFFTLFNDREVLRDLIIGTLAGLAYGLLTYFFDDSGGRTDDEFG